MVGSDIGIDLGTASILVYIKGKGVVLKEPSVVAFDRDTNKIKAIGEEARLMLGRTPGNIVAVRPLRQGVISDYTVTEKMIKHFIQKALGKKSFRKPLVSVCVPSGVTEVEKKAVEDATFAAGARDVKIIEEPNNKSFYACDIFLLKQRNFKFYFESSIICFIMSSVTSSNACFSSSVSNSIKAYPKLFPVS